MRILIVSDSWTNRWEPECRTLAALRAALTEQGHIVELAGPERIRSAGALAALCDGLLPQAVHLAEEGPLGRLARRLCLERGMPFTTACARPATARRTFHEPASRVIAAGDETAEALRARGWARVAVWSAGVDVEAFHPGAPLAVDAPRPLTAWAGRLDEERAVRRYLEAGLPGTLFVVGEGPRRRSLARAFPAARFPGALAPRALRALYATVDAYVHTDPRARVQLWEALACGTPVASLPDAALAREVSGSAAVRFGADLVAAVDELRSVGREACRELGLSSDAREAARRLVPLLARGEWWVPYDADAVASAA